MTRSRARPGDTGPAWGSPDGTPRRRTPHRVKGSASTPSRRWHAERLTPLLAWETTVPPGGERRAGRVPRE